MRYIPLSESDRADMLKRIGTDSVQSLFGLAAHSDAPRHLLELPDPMSEADLLVHMESKAENNTRIPMQRSFRGAGAYPHFVPTAVDQLLLRAEIFTCYTPYQPEVSQGTLMAIYEYQTYTAALFGLDVANASMYDGASALAEAVIMAVRIKRKNKVLISNLVHPHWREVITTYTKYLDIELVVIDDSQKGIVDHEKLATSLCDQTAAYVVQNPNFFGNIEELSYIRDHLNKYNALMIVAAPEPVAFGVLKGPGQQGADIVAGEGRSFGGSLSFGGPALGMMAVKKEYARMMPGRLVGKTKDVKGNDGYVLTLATREQHIRREKATSNICSNQALLATAAAIHISLLGADGLRELAIRNLSVTSYLASSISQLAGYSVLDDNQRFNEIVIKTPVDPAIINKKLKLANYLCGIDLGEYYPDFSQHMLLCGTEVHNKKSIDSMVKVLSECG